MTGDLAALALAFIEAAPTPEHADWHVQAAVARGATAEQITHALDRMRAQQAAHVQTIPTQGDSA